LKLTDSIVIIAALDWAFDAFAVHDVWKGSGTNHVEPFPYPERVHRSFLQIDFMNWNRI
jgi:hypothetical protein